MNTKNLMSFFVTMIAIVLVGVALAPAVSAFGSIDTVYINGISTSPTSTDYGVFANDILGITVVATATANADDTRFIARILGEPGLSDVTIRFDAVDGSQYSRSMSIALPGLDDLDEEFTLLVSWENQNFESEKSITLTIQRQNDLLRILSVEFNDNVKAGDNLVIDTVILNDGRDEADETFVRATLIGTGASRMVFLGDLDAQDGRRDFNVGGNVRTEIDSDFEDSAFGRILLRIPENTAAGVYTLEIEAFNDDSSTIFSRKVVVTGASADSRILASGTSKTFATGTEQAYTLTIVNADNAIKVYEIIPESTSGLSVRAVEALVAVPAGSSRTVTVMASASEEGNFNFAVNVHSDGALVEKQSFTANVEGSSVGGNAAVVLTIILAIIFVVLLIVLIVLLTRKPVKSEDFGESYY